VLVNRTQEYDMRSIVTALIGSLLLLPSAASFAADTQPASLVQKVSTTRDDKVICHFLVYEGSLIRTTECHSQREWNNIRRAEEQDFREFQDRALTMGPH
jgi:hypothetical protein